MAQVELIQKYFNEINARANIAHKFESAYGAILATKFNAFNFIEWNENMVSSILAFFLNPNENHQQGAVYLEIFLKRLSINFYTSNPENIQVKTEDTTLYNRRVDIVLHSKTYNMVLGIENKLYAHTKDQKNQVVDYINYLKTISSNYKLIYLSPSNKKLTEYTAGKDFEILINERKLIVISYEMDIIPIIKDFIKNTENIRVKSFLQDFESKLIEHFYGKKTNDNTMIENYILESEINIKTAFDIQAALNLAKVNLREKINQEMDQLAIKYGGNYHPDYCHFEFSQLKNFYIKFNTEMNGIIYGLVKKSEFYAQNKDKIYLENLKAYLGVKFRTSEWWPLFYKQYDNIDHEPQFWIDVSNGSFYNFIESFIQKILNAPQNLINEL